MRLYSTFPEKGAFPTVEAVEIHQAKPFAIPNLSLNPWETRCGKKRGLRQKSGETNFSFGSLAMAECLWGWPGVFLPFNHKDTSHSKLHLEKVPACMPSRQRGGLTNNNANEPPPAPARPIRKPDGKGVLFPREGANMTGPFSDGTAHRK